MKHFIFIIGLLFAHQLSAETSRPAPESSQVKSYHPEGFKKRFQQEERLVFIKKSQTFFEVHQAFSFHNIDSKLERAKDITVSFYNANRNDFGSGYSFHFGTTRVQNNSNLRVDGDYIGFSHYVIKRYKFGESLQFFAHLGLGVIGGGIDNIPPQKNYLRALTNQQIASLIRLLSGKNSFAGNDLYLNLGIRNTYVFNKPSLEDAGFGSTLQYFVGLSLSGFSWLPEGI